MNCTRKLSRFTNNRNHEHSKEVDRILRYLIGTISCGLQYSSIGFPLQCYTDVDLACHKVIGNLLVGDYFRSLE